MSTKLAGNRRVWVLFFLSASIALIAAGVVANPKKADPLEEKMAALTAKVDEILLDPAIKSGSLHADKIDRIVPLLEVKEAKIVPGTAYTRLIEVVTEAKAEIEAELPGKPVEVMENVILSYLVIQNRLYTNRFGFLHHQNSSKVSGAPDEYESLNLRFPVSVGDALMIGRKTRFEANIWHVESKAGSGVYDKVELGPSPFEKYIDEDSALVGHMSYQNYAKAVLSRILQQRITNLWSIARMDPDHQNMKIELRGCGYHTLAQRYSSKSHFPGYYESLFRGDIYGDLVKSGDTEAVYQTLFAPVIARPVLSHQKTGALLEQFFRSQESFQIKFGSAEADPHWSNLWKQAGPSKFSENRNAFWNEKMDSAFKTANYPMDDWSETGLSNRLAEIAWHAELELLSAFLLKAAENERKTIAEFDDTAPDSLFYVKPEVRKAKSMQMVEEAAAPLKAQWLAEVKKGIRAAANSDLIKRVRAGKAERRFENHYQDLLPVLETAARAQKIKSLAYAVYNQQKLNWEDQKLLLRANYSTHDLSPRRFLLDQWNKLTLGLSRKEREEFERGSVDETLPRDLYDRRNDQLGMIPATVIGNVRLAPVDPSDLKNLFTAKLEAYAESPKSSDLKTLAAEIKNDRIAGEFLDSFFVSLGRDFAAAARPDGHQSAAPIDERNTPLFRVLAARLPKVLGEFDEAFSGIVLKEYELRRDLERERMNPRDNTYVAMPPLPLIKPVIVPQSKPLVVRKSKPVNPSKKPLVMTPGPERLNPRDNTYVAMPAVPVIKPAPDAKTPPPEHQIPITNWGRLKGPIRSTEQKARKEPTYAEVSAARRHLIQAFALLGLENFLGLAHPTPDTLRKTGVSYPIFKAETFSDRARYLDSRFKPATMADQLGQSLLDQKLLGEMITTRIADEKPILNLSLNSGEALVDRNYDDVTYTTLAGIGKKAYSFSGGINHALAKSYLKLGIRNAVEKLPAQVREACSAHGMFNAGTDKKGTPEEKGFWGTPGDVYDDFAAGDGWLDFKNIFNSAYNIRANLMRTNKDWAAYDRYWSKETRTKTDKILTDFVKPVEDTLFSAFITMALIELAPIAWYGAQGLILNGAGWAGLEFALAKAEGKDAIGWIMKTLTPGKIRSFAGKVLPGAVRYANGGSLLKGTGLLVDAAFITDFFLIHHIAYVELPNQLSYQIGLSHSSVGDASTVNPVSARDLKDFAAKIHGAQTQSFISGLINIPVAWSIFKGAKAVLKRPEAEALERLVAFGGKDAEVIAQEMVNPNLKNSATAAKELITKRGIRVFKDGARIMDLLEMQAIATSKVIGIEDLEPVLERAIEAVEKDYAKAWNEIKAFEEFAEGSIDGVKVLPADLKRGLPPPPKLNRQLYAAKLEHIRSWKTIMTETSWNNAVAMDAGAMKALKSKKDVATLLVIKRRYLEHLQERSDLLKQILDEVLVYKDRGTYRIGTEEASRDFYKKLFTSNLTDPRRNASEFYKAFKTGYFEDIKQPWYSNRIKKWLAADSRQYRIINRMGKDFDLLLSQFPRDEFGVYQKDALNGVVKLAASEKEARAADEATWSEWVDIEGNTIRYRYPAKNPGSGPAVEVTGTVEDVEWGGVH